MKTQVRYLKQCISISFLIGFVFWPKSEAFAYTSIEPWQNEAGPTRGVLFEPKAGYQSSDSNSVELNLNLNAALSPDISAFGRYSVQTDQLLGLSDKVSKSRDYELSLQVESTYSQADVVGFTGGLFLRTPLRFFGLSTFTAELGLGISTEPSTQNTFVPASLLVMHYPDTAGIFYGTGFSGQGASTNEDGWISYRAMAGYQNENGIRYGMELALPATPTNTQNVTAISFNLVIPFGARPRTFEETPAKAIPELSADLNPHYDLNAKITSMNEALYLIKIDKGSSDSIEKGQIFDIYSADNRMARAQVIAVKKDEAALNVIEYNQENWIELGFSARRISRGME